MENEQTFLAAWLNKAELINKNAICEKTGIDRSNLSKYLVKGVIPDQHVKKIVDLLKDYGYCFKREIVKDAIQEKVVQVVAKPQASPDFNEAIKQKIKEIESEKKPPFLTEKQFKVSKNNRIAEFQKQLN